MVYSADGAPLVFGERFPAEKVGYLMLSLLSSSDGTVVVP